MLAISPLVPGLGIRELTYSNVIKASGGVGILIEIIYSKFSYKWRCWLDKSSEQTKVRNDKIEEQNYLYG